MRLPLWLRRLPEQLWGTGGLPGKSLAGEGLTGKLRGRGLLAVMAVGLGAGRLTVGTWGTGLFTLSGRNRHHDLTQEFIR